MAEEILEEGFTKKHEMNGMFDGPILKVLVKIAFPIFLGMMFQLLYAIVDIIWISRIDLSDPSYVGGVGLIFPLLFFAVAVSSGVLIGVGSLVARSIGEKNQYVLDRIAESGFSITFLISVVIITLGYVFDEQILTILGAKNEYFIHALDYLHYIIPVAGLMIMGNVLLGILLGEGLTSKVMIAMIITTVANVILDPVFIFLLRMEVKGAGIATVISQVITAIYLIRIFLRRKTIVRIEWNLSKTDFGIIKKIFSVGFPQTAGQMTMALSVLLFNRLVIGIDRLALTAFSICSRFDQVLIIPVMAIGSSMITMIGQNFGRGNLSRVKEIWKTGVLMGMAVSALLAMLLVIFAPRIFPFFTKVDAVAGYAVLQMRVIEFSFVLASVAIVGRASFQAIGRPIPGLIVAALQLALVSIPVAYFLVFAMDMGMYGVWIGIITGNALSSLIGFLWVRRVLNTFISGPALNPVYS
jgi:putative MATE family efflux protein